MYNQRGPPPPPSRTEARQAHSQGGAPPHPPPSQQYYHQFPGPPLPQGGAQPPPPPPTTNYTGRFPVRGEASAPAPYPGSSVHRGPPPPPPSPQDNSWNSRFQSPPRFDRPPPLPPTHSEHFPPTRCGWQFQGNQQHYAPFGENSYQRYPTHERSEAPAPVLQNKTENSAPPRKTDDQLWLENWLKKKNIKKRERLDRKSISIPEAKKLFRRAYKLLQELEDARTSLNNAIDESSDEGNRMHNNVISIQKQLEEVQQNLDMEQLKKKCKRVVLKRARLKRQRRRLYEERQEAEEQRRLRHEEIDQWQAALLEKQLENKREKELKAAADATLSEVRKKLGEARRCKEVLERLTKLRQVRKDAMERMGLYTAKESDASFVGRRDALSEMMGRQLETYETEETALKVMLEAEAEESKEQIREQTTANREKQQARLKTRLRHLLFGMNETPGVSEDIRPFWEYYTAADADLQTFLTVRQHWDSYIVPDGSAGGSSVPPGWVTPTAPSDPTWESALKHYGGKT